MKRGRNQRRRQGVNPNRALDSNGPDVRIRGTANQIYDKYQALARDAASSGDRVKAESYLQHAEHYFRLIRSIQSAQQPQQPLPQHSQADANGEQPTIDDDDNQGGGRRQSSGRDERTANGAANGAESETESDDNAEVGAAAEEGAETRKPRRRRPRRPSKQADEGDSNESEEPAAAAE